MALIVNISDAKAHFSKLLKRVALGEELIIAKKGKPSARLVPYVEKKSLRFPGSARGQFTIGADFDAPLTEFEPM